ncbi:MAG: cupin domain-containing protein [Pseudomonadota bacterium]
METTDPGLPQAAVERMLLDIAPEPLAPEAVARIKARLAERVAAEPRPAAPQFIDIRADEGWRPLTDRTEMKILFDDGATLSWLVRMQPGARLDAHAHDAGPEECLVIEGELWLDGKRFGAGDYQLASRGTAHHRIHTESGCVLFVRSPSPRAAASAGTR